MQLTDRGISHTPGTETVQTPTTAKYRGLTYETTRIPAASSSNVLKYRGIAYATGTATVGQGSAERYPACVLPAFA